MQSLSLSRTLLVRATRGCRTRPLAHVHHAHHDRHKHHRCHLSYTPMAPPPLFDLCVRKSFGEALQRAQTHPHEAAFKHPRNWTALHCCVEHVAPLDVVKAIYRAYPQNVTTKDWQGITPAEAAVDLETKAYLQQQASVALGNDDATTKSAKQSSVGNDPTSVGARTSVTNNPNNDAMLLGKVINHSNNLAGQVVELSASTERLRKEIDDLKATLRAMSTK